MLCVYIYVYIHTFDRAICCLLFKNQEFSIDHNPATLWNTIKSITKCLAWQHLRKPR